MHHENEKMALFEALYREYLVPLKKYAYRIGVGYDDIEDMAVSYTHLDGRLSGDCVKADCIFRGGACLLYTSIGENSSD